MDTQQCCYWTILQCIANMWSHQLWPKGLFGSQSCPPVRSEGNMRGVGNERPPTLDSYQLWQTRLTFRSRQGKNLGRSSTRDGTTWGCCRGLLDVWRRARNKTEEEKPDDLTVLSWSCQATVNAEESCNSVYILSPQAGVGKPRMGGACR